MFEETIFSLIHNDGRIRSNKNRKVEENPVENTIYLTFSRTSICMMNVLFHLLLNLVTNSICVSDDF